METHFFRLIKVVAVLAAIGVAAGGCSTSQKHSSSKTAGSDEVMGPPVPYGPLPAQATEPGEQYGPAPIQLKPIVLIFGPGLARGFAYGGVLRALEEAKVPIAGIVGTEMGALTGGLYSMNGSISGYEWALLKIKDSAFGKKSGLFPKLIKGSDDGKALAEALNEVLGEKDLGDAKIPVFVGLQADDAQDPVFISKGSAAKALRATMGMAEFMAPGEWGSGNAESAALLKPFPVAEARQVFSGLPVVVVDVIRKTSRKLNPNSDEWRAARTMTAVRKNGEMELRAADLLIEPDLGDIGYLDFEKRSEISFRGKQAVMKQLQVIRRIAGLTRDSTGGSP